jgi:perosamine synthetase
MTARDRAQFVPELEVPVSAPVITDAAKRYVSDAMESGWVSSGGPAVGRFEEAFARYLGVRHAVTTSSGTTALHLALASLGIGPGDEVIVPDFTMLSPVSAVLYTGAHPVLVDCEPATFNIDVGRVAEVIGPRTRAVVAVHLYGHSADMDPLLELAADARIPVIEDAAEAHGASYKGRKCGAMGRVGCFSFYGNKIVTSGEGGMLVTDDAVVAERARKLRNMAHSDAQRFVHDDLGFSYRMSNLQAACGLGQLEGIDDFLAHRQWMAAEYARRLSAHRELRLPVTKPGCVNVHWMYAVLLAREGAPSRDRFRAELRARGVETRSFFASAASQPVVRSRAGNQGPFPVSEDASARGLYLPSGLALTPAQLQYVCDAIADVLACVS